MSDDKVAQIAKLLALAERSSGPEAELAFLKAQKIANLHAVDLEVARRQMTDKSKREAPIQKRISFESGLATKNTKKSLVELMCAIARSNDVKVNIFGNSTGVIGFGMPSDLQLMEQIFGVVAVQMIKGANEFLRTKAYRNETVPAYNEWGGYEGQKPMHGHTAKQNYYSAFISEISVRLRDIKLEAEKSVSEQKVKVVQEDGTTGEVSTALVLVGKRDEIEKFYTTNSRAKGHWQASRAGSYSRTASSAGRSDGRAARLGREAQIGGSRTAIR